MGVLDTLRAATARTVTETVYLDAALEDEWNRLSDQLPDAAKTDDHAASLAEPDASLADPMPETRRVVEAMEEIREQMQASAVIFTFTQIPWGDRIDLQATHRPREGNLVDAIRGWNVETFTPALIRACCTQVTDSAGDTLTEIPDDVWDTLLGIPEQPADGDQPAAPAVAGTLSYRQVTTLFAAALKVTDGETQVPPSARSLLENKDSGASLAQPGPGTPPPSGSAGGSRRTARKSSATTKAGSTSS